MTEKHRRKERKNKGKGRGRKNEERGGKAGRGDVG